MFAKRMQILIPLTILSVAAFAFVILFGNPFLTSDAAPIIDTTIFDASVAQADPKCRHEVLQRIKSGRSVSFRYEIVGGMWGGIAGMKGIFAPPDSVHSEVVGAKNHGGGIELIRIGNRTWTKTEDGNWVETRSKPEPAPTNLPRLSDILFVPDYVPLPLDATFVDYIGNSNCLGEISDENRRLLSYKFETYRDKQMERKLVARRNMLVDSTKGLPTRIDTIDARGQVFQRETRLYEPGITIKIPAR